ncbi:PIN domain-containing protein [Galbitalea soli]|uniref:PIN domain-containing protein n=1 Tax=Galbitalea soli TaxID=1268042 RepID=A0A7C9TSC8_9MICO|nr:PIN domain-containing protein [Galbitalea soli]NYJ32070.1 putative nucleic acid-binding protein [Galbitalea soli]
MTSAEVDERAPIRVVLADANVLYSRVLRDYLLYAATQGLLEIRWSAEILAEVIEHLAENIVGFDAAAGARLVAAMNGAFPAAEVEPDSGAEAAVADLPLPDEDDRHVLAAAVAIGADVLCTDNLKDYPADAMEVVGIRLMSADALLTLLLTEFPDGMLAAHRLAVSRLPGATDESTLVALRRAGAGGAVNGIANLLVP